ncbi:hypothetical protein [Solwaraspora sp. WMMA2101]|uniref:hypothetical protein n=1 Tax=Solwaraspora sp. WMMA2101 TaxID=3404124 RepID=UPI003B9290C1
MGHVGENIDRRSALNDGEHLDDVSHPGRVITKHRLPRLECFELLAVHHLDPLNAGVRLVLRRPTLRAEVKGKLRWRPCGQCSAVGDLCIDHLGILRAWEAVLG